MPNIHPQRTLHTGKASKKLEEMTGMHRNQYRDTRNRTLHGTQEVSRNGLKKFPDDVPEKEFTVMISNNLSEKQENRKISQWQWESNS